MKKENPRHRLDPDENTIVQFFAAMIPPTKTHQEKQIRVINGKPILYEPQELKSARHSLEAHLAPYVPQKPFLTPVRLLTKWCFPAKGEHRNGEYKATRPDTDNLQKMLKDVMTRLGFWKDDALVVSEITEKFWADIPGIFIRIEAVERGDAY